MKDTRKKETEAEDSRAEAIEETKYVESQSKETKPSANNIETPAS